MAKGFRNGPGGVSQNFKVVGGLTQPTNHSKNTLWIKTDVEITGCKLSKYEPKNPIEGFVWILLGDASHVAFHTLKMCGREFDEVYPICAKQYVGDKFVGVPAMTYQGDEWHNWRVYLYKAGDQCEDITGGWSAYDGAGGTTTFTATHINCVTDGSDERYATPYTVKKVDVTNHSKLLAEINERDSTLGTNMYLASAITGYKSAEVVSAVSSSIVGEQTLEMDISAISGEYYVVFSAYTSNFAVSNVWLE